MAGNDFAWGEGVEEEDPPGALCRQAEDLLVEEVSDADTAADGKGDEGKHIDEGEWGEEASDV